MQWPLWDLVEMMAELCAYLVGLLAIGVVIGLLWRPLTILTATAVLIYLAESAIRGQWI